VPLAGIALEVDVETGSERPKTGGVSAKTCCSPIAACPVRPFCRFRVTGTGNADRHQPAAGSGCGETLIEGKGTIKKQLGNVCRNGCRRAWPKACWLANGFELDARLADMPDAQLRKLGAAINRWTIVPNGSEGYRKAEVTRGGVDTRELSQQSMMVTKVPGLYFIGEAVDVTGWLGGYNFQWAWASGVAAEAV
jgi:hypothetical protein